MDKKNHNICFLTAAYPSPAEPQRGCFVETLALAIKETGYDLYVVTPKIYKKDSLFEKRKGFSITRFPFFSGNKLLMHRGKTPIIRMAIYILSGFFAAMFIIIRKKCSLIHSNWILPTGLIGILCSFITGKPQIIMARGADVNIIPYRSKILFKLTKFVLKYSKRIITVSHQARDIFIKEYGISRNKISIISSGVDLKFFKPISSNKCRKSLKLKGKKHIGVFIGDLIPRKGVVNLIEGYNTLPESIRNNLCIYIIGDGPLREEFKTKVDKLKLNKNIIFLGRQARNKIPLWINASDFIILPSLNEGTPNSVMEALACKTPVLASAVDGTKKLIKDRKSGILFRSGDSRDISKKIEDFYKNKAVRNKIENFLKKEYDFNRIDVKQKGREVIQIYNEILGK